MKLFYNLRKRAQKGGNEKIYKIAKSDKILTDMVAGIAKKHQMYIIAPIYEADGDKVYNTAIVFNRDLNRRFREYPKRYAVPYQ